MKVSAPCTAGAAVGARRVDARWITETSVRGDNASRCLAANCPTTTSSTQTVGQEDVSFPVTSTVRARHDGSMRAAASCPRTR